MTRTIQYKTKQREEILTYLKLMQGEHVTVQDIINYFDSNNKHIGTTTIYRHLEKLIDVGIVKKYVVDHVSGAYFEYVGDDPINEHRFYLKCEVCSQLIPFQCRELQHVQDHLYKAHGFQINSPKTIFYGICKNCSDKGATQ